MDTGKGGRRMRQRQNRSLPLKCASWELVWQMHSPELARWLNLQRLRIVTWMEWMECKQLSCATLSWSVFMCDRFCKFWPQLKGENKLHQTTMFYGIGHGHSLAQFHVTSGCCPCTQPDRWTLQNSAGAWRDMTATLKLSRIGPSKRLSWCGLLGVITKCRKETTLPTLPCHSVRIIGNASWSCPGNRDLVSNASISLTMVQRKNAVRPPIPEPKTSKNPPQTALSRVQSANQSLKRKGENKEAHALTNK